MIKKKDKKMPIKGIKKDVRIKSELPGGFRDYDPREAIARAQMIKTICKTFENFGFDPLETSSVQRTEVLTGGEENSGKIILNVKGSQEKKSDTSLRFDLTVPLARFIAANPDIPKPFKRYQIGTVWRGERPQVGRYREFTQADIDIVGSTAMQSDAEIIFVIYTTLKNLGVDEFVIKINNRKILNTLLSFANLTPKGLQEALRIIDKTDKIGNTAINKELEKTFGKKISAKIKDFFESKEINKKIGGYAEIIEIEKNLGLMGVKKSYYQIDTSIVRGLGYYTGPIFETILTNMPEIGSIFSGGRYDNLVTRFTGQSIPAVGASMGVDRLFTAMERIGALKKQQTLTRVLILNLSAEFATDYFEIAQQFRDANINTSFYLGDDMSFQAQFSYAVKKEIPFVMIYGEREKAKGVIAIKKLADQRQVNIPFSDVINFERYFKK